MNKLYVFLLIVSLLIILYTYYSVQENFQGVYSDIMNYNPIKFLENIKQPDFNIQKLGLPKLDDLSKLKLPKIKIPEFETYKIKIPIPDLSNLDKITDKLPDLNKITDKLPDLDKISDKLPKLDKITEKLPNLDLPKFDYKNVLKKFNIISDKSDKLNINNLDKLMKPNIAKSIPKKELNLDINKLKLSKNVNLLDSVKELNLAQNLTNIKLDENNPFHTEYEEDEKKKLTNEEKRKLVLELGYKDYLEYSNDQKSGYFKKIHGYEDIEAYAAAVEKNEIKAYENKFGNEPNQIKETRSSANLEKAPYCVTWNGKMSGYERIFYGMAEKPCKVGKTLGIAYDKDGLYYRYYDILSNKWKLKHLTSDPKVYTGPNGSHYT